MQKKKRKGLLIAQMTFSVVLAHFRTRLVLRRIYCMSRTIAIA